RRYGEDLAAAVPPARSRIAALRAVGSRPRPVRRLPRVAAATVGFFAIANVAAAAVSNSAVPGDVLYPLDRAYEAAGRLIGFDDHTAERLAEAELLVERSDLPGALDLVVEAMPDPELEGVTAQLRQAGTDDEVRRLVLNARGLGQAIREGNHEAMAESRAALRLLASQVSGRDPGATPAEPATPAQPGQPGQPADPATPAIPADPGNQGNQGNSDNQGNQGNSDNQGNSNSSGNSGNSGNRGNQDNSGPGAPDDKGQGSGGRP
ncbi:MAG TPA: hypothetical protein VLB85_06425, partial [Acidimicrobiia bacterium]|nr:hypothetical protein [Acidimicrobiia bacterium]